MPDPDRELAEARAQIEGARAAMRLAAERIGSVRLAGLSHAPLDRDALSLALGTLEGALAMIDAQREQEA